MFLSWGLEGFRDGIQFDDRCVDTRRQSQQETMPVHATQLDVGTRIAEIIYEQHGHDFDANAGTRANPLSESVFERWVTDAIAYGKIDGVRARRVCNPARRRYVTQPLAKLLTRRIYVAWNDDKRRDERCDDKSKTTLTATHVTRSDEHDGRTGDSDMLSTASASKISDDEHHGSHRTPFNPMSESHKVYEDLFSHNEWNKFQENMRTAISHAEIFASRNKHPNMGWDGIHNDVFFDERTKRHIVGDAKKYHFDLLKASNRKCIGLGETLKIMNIDVVELLKKAGVIPKSYYAADGDLSIIAIKTVGPCTAQLPHTDYPDNRKGFPEKGKSFSLLLGIEDEGSSIMIHKDIPGDTRKDTLNMQLFHKANGCICISGEQVHGGSPYCGREDIRIHMYLAEGVPKKGVQHKPVNAIYPISKEDVTAEQYIRSMKKAKTI